MTAIVHLIKYMKNKKVFHLFCERCETQFKEELPIKVKLENVICPNCKTDGFVIGHKKSRPST